MAFSALHLRYFKRAIPEQTAIFLGLMPILLIAIPESFAAQSAPSSLSVSVGSFSGTVANLAKANEGKVVNLYTNRSGNLTALVVIPASGLNQNKLLLSSSFLQKRSSDIFQFKYKNANGAYVSVGSTSGSANGYKSLQFSMPSSAVVGNSITVQLTSSAGASDAKLDALIISDSGSSPAPSPSPSPSPRPSPSPSPSVSPSPTPSPVGSVVSIPAGTKWYWQLQGTVNTNESAKVYDIDLFDNGSQIFAELKSAGHIVTCYFSAGTYEPGRPDSNQFPASALGNGVKGWPGEKWLDVRDATVRQIMMARMDLAVEKGCQALEPDNVDGYSNKPGFPLTAQDQIDFNTFLADQAHARGLAVGLKNSTDLVNALVNKYDFAVVEQCFQYNECSSYSPFINQNKAVLEAEYSSYSSAVCSKATSLDFSTAFYNLDLNGKTYNPCP